LSNHDVLGFGIDYHLDDEEKERMLQVRRRRRSE